MAGSSMSPCYSVSRFLKRSSFFPIGFRLGSKTPDPNARCDFDGGIDDLKGSRDDVLDGPTAPQSSPSCKPEQESESGVETHTHSPIYVYDPHRVAWSNDDAYNDPTFPSWMKMDIHRETEKTSRLPDMAGLESVKRCIRRSGYGMPDPETSDPYWLPVDAWCLVGRTKTEETPLVAFEQLEQSRSEEGVRHSHFEYIEWKQLTLALPVEDRPGSYQISGLLYMTHRDFDSLINAEWARDQGVMHDLQKEDRLRRRALMEMAVGRGRRDALEVGPAQCHSSNASWDQSEAPQTSDHQSE